MFLLLSRLLRIEAFVRQLLRRNISPKGAGGGSFGRKCAANGIAKVAFSSNFRGALPWDVGLSCLDSRMRKDCKDDVGGAVLLI
jgi:hypothetical protein